MNRNGFHLAAGIVVPILVVAFLAFVERHWEWDKIEPFSAAIRNIGLVVGGALALALAAWRGYAADRQARTAEQQARLAEREALDGRYQSAAALLSDGKLHVRSAGVVALYRLGLAHREQYAPLCAVVLRNFCVDRRAEEPDAGPTEVRTAAEVAKTYPGPADAALAEHSADELDRIRAEMAAAP